MWYFICVNTSWGAAEAQQGLVICYRPRFFARSSLRRTRFVESGDFLGILFFHSQEPELIYWEFGQVEMLVSENWRELERSQSAANGLGHCAAVGIGKASLTMGNEVGKMEEDQPDEE